MGCDRFLRRTSRFRYARTSARTLILWWLHFAPAPFVIYNRFFCRSILLDQTYNSFGPNFGVFFNVFFSVAKKYAKVQSIIARPKMSHMHAHCTYVPIAVRTHKHTCDRYRSCACTHAPSQPTLVKRLNLNFSRAGNLSKS